MDAPDAARRKVRTRCAWPAPAHSAAVSVLQRCCGAALGELLRDAGRHAQQGCPSGAASRLFFPASGLPFSPAAVSSSSSTLYGLAPPLTNTFHPCQEYERRIKGEPPPLSPAEQRKYRSNMHMVGRADLCGQLLAKFWQSCVEWVASRCWCLAGRLACPEPLAPVSPCSLAGGRGSGARATHELRPGAIRLGRAWRQGGGAGPGGAGAVTTGAGGGGAHLRSRWAGAGAGLGAAVGGGGPGCSREKPQPLVVLPGARSSKPKALQL